MTEIVVTDEFKGWYEALSINEQEPVFRAVTLLEELGTKLGFPYSSAIQRSRYPLRELRVQHRGRPLRVFYAFDPERQAVLLLGGDKGGKARFYEEHVPRAEALWEQYLRERTAERSKE
ncbi:MAG TPA: type II toxin-antitoxin system RelE/ParE family toxin [Thermoanaerobaculia bacterium]|nr:type II toxin-antitoxin system RelE/ParE family toxin [Thermoanaerobaculia bacterium]